MLSGDAPNFIYAYWPDLDRVSHDRGTASKAVARHLQEVDAAVAELLQRLEGTDSLLILTADHGHIDTTREGHVELGDHPVLARMIERPLCGEQRVAYCYVRPGHSRRLEEYVHNELGEYVNLVESAALIRDGFFGLGTPHPRLAERVGDYTFLMRGSCTIKDWLPGERKFVHVGSDGGLSPQEIYVPLVVAER